MLHVNACAPPLSGARPGADPAPGGERAGRGGFASCIARGARA